MTARDASLARLLRSITRDQGSQKDSPLLSVLPIEIRQHIYEYLLPSTVPLRDLVSGGIAHVWHQGNTSIMAACCQLHDECAEKLYGESVFIVEVGYDTILMRHRRLLDSGLVPEATPSFLDLIGPPYLRRIRHLAINIKHVDSYTGRSCSVDRRTAFGSSHLGMIKHNCGGPGLTDGLRGSVQELVDALKGANELQIVRVNLQDQNGDAERAQVVLQPFRELSNFAEGGGIMLTGDVTRASAEGLARGRDGHVD